MSRSHHLLLRATLGSASLVMASTTCVTTEVPELGAGLRATQIEVQWIADAHPVVLAGRLLPAGALLDVRLFAHRTFGPAACAIFAMFGAALG